VKPKTIHLGYEIGSGERVEIPLRHLAVTGQTQDSGKTTTLEALISRSELKAIAFVTKRGERSFQTTRTSLPPYFRERADWQFVSSILEATFREKMKFERSWIMKVCRGAHSLSDVAANVQKALATARGLSESVYTTLDEYFKIVMPELEGMPIKPLRLDTGLNVMDLSAYSTQMQQLVIASSLQHVYEHEEGVVTVIPEAWEFIPQQRNSPVKLACETLIRKGAVLGNYIWLDSQDIAAVAKDVLRSIAVWIIGVQREANEVERALKHIPFGSPLPSKKDVMALGRGEFFVCFGREMHKVYVQPAWMTPTPAIEIALGSKSVESVNRPQAKPQDQEDPMYKEKYEQAQGEIKLLQQKIQQLQESLNNLKSTRSHHQVEGKKAGSVGAAVSEIDREDLYQYVLDRLQREAPQLLSVTKTIPEIEVTVKREKLRMDTTTVKGQMAVLLSDGFFDQRKGNKEVLQELASRGWPNMAPNVSNAFKDLTQMGFLMKTDNGQYKAVAGMKVRVVEA